MVDTGLMHALKAPAKVETRGVRRVAWGVLILLACLRGADSFTYVPIILLLCGFSLIAALFTMWITWVVRLGRQRLFRWGPILMMVGLALICANPVGDALHEWGFQLARARLETALVSGDCPSWAGPYRIAHCSTINGSPFFVLADSGLVGIDGLVKPSDPARDTFDGISHPVGDGWYFVSISY